MSEAEILSVELTEAFIRLITKHTGLKIRERERESLIQKIFSRMKALKILYPEIYYKVLASSSIYSYVEWQKFIAILTNTESYFFRDKEQFNLLRNHIIPEIIKRKYYSKNIRICSAGCSTGEEPYSLAIVLKELIPNLEEWNLMILGLDINKEALKKAKQGIYTAWSLRSLDRKTIQKYFLKFNNKYYLDEQIKQIVKFQYTNLVTDLFIHPYSDFQDIDLILCRNVFIYFESTVIAKIVDKFYDTLQPLGYLITGHTELCGQKLSKFQTKLFPESLVYIKK
ncbi:CheR family methyltransferase [Fischerella thermalis]|uniref:CheR family methyltransferase n=1 Tax=Fischerella thermalis TaxID=372787 RepID=UPI0019E00BB6|nr:protein-glutamate O-methyltransferase CheR [Fischerella thermalis]MBF1988793.1 protein-glutamate O-methyltransferase CheR [Fischerella thermalis M58_A2018_009]MBF2061004.1 protein-glutamate O-methyltransferase CheR [Fischerella thermalis M66_A2018_004]MBF2071748.1 protein-glutamate O-methyltransferase CheR [Fischerella thermalis M48_A2018_028]